MDSTHDYFWLISLFFSVRFKRLQSLVNDFSQVIDKLAISVESLRSGYWFKKRFKFRQQRKGRPKTTVESDDCGKDTGVGATKSLS